MRRVPAAATLVALSMMVSAAAAQVPGRVGPAVELVPNRPLPSQGGAIIRLAPHPKVIGPDAGPAPEFKSVVAIYYNKADGGRYICTGTLLTPTLVLTAGHCGCGLPGSYTVDFRLDARSGVQTRVANVEDRPILFDQRVCRGGNLSNGRDLALLRLIQIENNDDTHPSMSGYPHDLIWDLRAQLVPKRRLTAVGYGYAANGHVGFRNHVTIPIASGDCTSRRYRNICMPFGEMALAEAPGPRLRSDTCGGDSGGPIFLIAEDGRPTLVAVTSRAAPGSQDNPLGHCGGGGIYVIVGRKSVQAWLRANGANEIPVQAPKPKPDKPTPPQPK
jgi:hypothetical protein